MLQVRHWILWATFAVFISACGGGGGGPTTYTISGTVTGLSGSGLVLQNNGGDDLAISANGSFSFSTALNDADPYAVTVLTQPSNPGQVCTVTNDSGAVAAVNVTNVAINCVTNTHTIGGTVGGLTGSGLVLQNNGGDDLAINADGGFTFATALDDLSAYAVTVLTQPSSPNQVCTVANDSGNLAGSDVTNVAITCVTTTYTVGGSVSGLVGSGLVLINNGSDNLPISANGSFTFATPLADGSAYAVTVSNNPSSPNQTCSVTNNGSGNITGSDVTNVDVVCVTTSYTVSATVSDLAGTGLVLQNYGNDLTINTNGTFSFPSQLDGSAYAVTVSNNPSSPNQVCSVGPNGSGNLTGSDITVAITCVTNTYTVSATVSGLTGTGLVLQNNGGNDLTINADGIFPFPSQPDGNPYAVTILTQPSGSPAQTCSVTSGSGNLNGSNITVAVNCTISSFTVGGTVSGLAGSGLVLQNNSDDDLMITTNGTFTFATALDDLSSYAVTVFTQPSNPNQTCTVTNESGSLTGSNITNIDVECITNIVLSTVNSLYSNGANWNDYVLDDGVDRFSATDLACISTDSACLHGGELRTVTVTGRSDCTGLTADDALGLFDWICDDSTGNVRMISTGFKSDKKLSDLLDFTTPGWLGNQINVYENSVLEATTTATAWWTNPIVVNNDGSDGSDMTAGEVHIITANADATYTFGADSVALVLQPGVTLTSTATTNENIISANNNNFLWFEGELDATGNDNGVFLLLSNFSTLRGVVASNANIWGVNIASSSNNRLSHITASGNSWTGIHLTGSSNNTLSNIIGSANTLHGVLLNNSSNNKLSNITTIGNAQNGIQYNASSNNNTLSNVTASGNTWFGLNIESSSNNKLDNVTATDNAQHGVYLYLSSNNTLSNVTASGNNYAGIILEESSNNTLHNILASGNNLNGIFVTASSINTFNNITAANNTLYGIFLNDTSDNTFTGLLQVGTNALGSCQVTGGTAPGLVDDICVAPADTDPVLTTGITVAGSFIGAGDYSLLAADTVLREVLALPAGDDTLTHTWSDMSTTTLLRNAVEILDDGIGNDNLLCETGETCLFSPNIAAYQGHGNLISAGTFVDGALTGITLLRYDTNGY